MQRWTATMQRQSSRNPGGFTLIELMIAIAIVGILSAIAYPQYTETVQNSRRGDGRLALLDAVQSIERCRATKFTYTGCVPSAAYTSPEGYYIISATESTATGFKLKAKATGKQAGDKYCKNLTINNLGTRTPNSTKNCWPI